MLDNDKFLVLYFNCWGGTQDQSLYLNTPLTKIINQFRVFTIGFQSIGGFNYQTIPGVERVTSPGFKKSIISLFKLALQQIIEKTNEILLQNPEREIVLMSHSLGYTILFLTLLKSNLIDRMDKIKNIILLDPAGQALTKGDLLQDTEIFGNFIKKFRLLYLDSLEFLDGGVFLEWRRYILNSTLDQFTKSEKVTGMYQYIIDGDCNSELDLSIYAYAINYYPISKIISLLTIKYPNLIFLLTSTNGLAYQNLDYWKKLGINQIEIVSDSGHFLHIFSQKKTIKNIYRILNKPMGRIILYKTSYNAPLNDDKVK